jgi:hypothetical protein
MSHLIKPGVAEATRVLLRRVPEQLLVRHPGDADVHHLLDLAETQAVPIAVEPDMPFRAAALIHSHPGARAAADASPAAVRSNEP